MTPFGLRPSDQVEIRAQLGGIYGAKTVKTEFTMTADIKVVLLNGTSWQLSGMNGKL